MIEDKIGFIGCGKMARALIKSLINAGINNRDIYVSDVIQEPTNIAKKEFNVNVCVSNEELVYSSNIIFLSVKPQNMREVLEGVKDAIKNKLVISIAAGVTLSFIESLIESKIVRVMPNIACLVGEMAAGYALSKNFKEEDEEKVKIILNSGGYAIKVEEELLDVVTALSGSGPAFISYYIDAMVEGAVKQGLNRKTALSLAIQTCFGTTKLLKEKNIEPKKLIEMVKSPGGTTEEGIKIADDSNLKEIIMKKIDATTRRSKELSKG